LAIQKFDAVVREAMWIAHSKKCAYTHELVDLASMHIDHIIPESLAGKSEMFAEVRAKLGLPDNFDLFGLGNLFPAKPRANLQKGDLTLNVAAAHFFLSIAASKKALIEQNIEKQHDGGGDHLLRRELLLVNLERADHILKPVSVNRAEKRLQSATIGEKRPRSARLR
jgi:hypothetical protein